MPNIAYGPRHVAPAGRRVFYGLFRPEKTAKIEMRRQLLIGLEQWLEKSRMMQAEAAKALGVTQARVSDRKRGKIHRFSTDLLVRVRSFRWTPSQTSKAHAIAVQCGLK
jgi:predicted XRE-type DNA-binding protein